MTCEAPVADPTEDIPADEPAGHGEGEFGGRAAGAGSRGTSGVRAMRQTAANLQGMFQGVDPANAVITDVESPSATSATILFDIENQTLKLRILWPAEAHGEPPVALVLSSLSYSLRSMSVSRFSDR